VEKIVFFIPSKTLGFLPLHRFHSFHIFIPFRLLHSAASNSAPLATLLCTAYNSASRRSASLPLCGLALMRGGTGNPARGHYAGRAKCRAGLCGAGWLAFPSLNVLNISYRLASDTE